MSKAQQIKHYTQITTGVIAILIIYICTFTTTYLVVGKALDGTQNNATAQEQKPVQYSEEF